MAEHFFNLHNESGGIHRSLADGVTTQIFPGEQAMLSVVRIEAESESARHSHPEEQWGVLLEGNGVRIQNDIERPGTAGDFWQTPVISAIHMLIHAVMAGSVVMLVIVPESSEWMANIFLWGIGLNIVIMMKETFMFHDTPDNKKTTVKYIISENIRAKTQLQ